MPGLNSFRHPGAHDEVTNLSFHAHQIAGAHAELCRVARVNPERIRVRDFVQPLRVRAARVNLNRQTKGRNQNRLIRFEIVRMNVTLDVSRNRVFGPTPISQRSRIEFQLAARCGKAAFDFVVNCSRRQGAGHRHRRQDWEPARCLATQVSARA